MALRQRAGRLATHLAATALPVGMLRGSASSFPLLMDPAGFTWSSSRNGGITLQSVGVLKGFEPWDLVTASGVYTYHVSAQEPEDPHYFGNGPYLHTYPHGRGLRHLAFCRFRPPGA